MPPQILPAEQIPAEQIPADQPPADQPPAHQTLTLEQQVVLIRRAASHPSPAVAERMRWRVALCWSRYARLTSEQVMRRGGQGLCLDDLQQAALLSIYEATRR